MVQRQPEEIPSAPILVIVFNRPSKTRNIVDFLKKLPPRSIYVAADGARHSGEADRCHEVRQIVSELASYHHVETRFSDINLGCGKNVAGAIQWVLEKNEETIIVEDDVQITNEFIQFCDASLSFYKSESVVAAISGGPLQNLNKENFPPLFMTSYPNIWGWATWRRSFHCFDLELKEYSNWGILSVIRQRFGMNIVSLYWWIIILLVRSRRIDTWDFQFYFRTWADHAYTLTPRANLTQNVGFDSEATHVHTAPSNVGQLDGDTETASMIRAIDTLSPSANRTYEAQLDSTLYRINWFTLAKLVAKYVVTRPRSYY